MFEDIIGEPGKLKELILEVDDIISYVHYMFDGGQLEVDINFSTKEVEISGPFKDNKYCYRKLRDIHRILKDKSPFDEINIIQRYAQLIIGWVFI